MGSISRHITPLVINSLGRGHTHTHARMHTNMHTDDPNRINSKKPGVTGRRAPGIKIDAYYNDFVVKGASLKDHIEEWDTYQDDILKDDSP